MAWLCGPTKVVTIVYKTFPNISGNMWGVDFCRFWGVGGLIQNIMRIAGKVQIVQ